MSLPFASIRLGWRRVLVTRPAQQAPAWVDKLRALGLPAQALPLLGIEGAADPHAVATAWQATQAAAAQLDPSGPSNPPSLHPQLMFVSPNAAQCWHQALIQVGAWQGWPEAVRALATGPGTVAALRQAGVPAHQIVAPDEAARQFDSEALWARIQHEDWPHQPTWIVRGEGGRDWLATTLRAAGASVAFVQAYARSAPQWQAQEVACLRAALAEPEASAWLISSSEALEHLPGLLARHAPEWVPRWAAATAVASHPRIAANCRAWGFGRVLEARPTPEAVAQALQA